jgi:hypothetical protein
MGMLERGADLAGDQQRMVRREREAVLARAVEHGVEALGLQELVRDVVRVVHLADAMDLEEVRVVQLRRELHLVHQGFDGVGMTGQRGLEPQEGDDLLEAGGRELGGAMLRAEATGLDLFEKHELTELLFPGHGALSRCENRRQNSTQVRDDQTPTPGRLQCPRCRQSPSFPR